MVIGRSFRNRMIGKACAACVLLGALIVPSVSNAGAPASRPRTTQAAGQSQPIRYGPGRKIATLADRRIRESSGLAWSRRRANVFWTHNDSGGGAHVYAFDLHGKGLGVFTVPGASARDWEDMASFVMDRKSYLLLADTGDNHSRRKFCALHIVEEPRIGSAAGPATPAARLVRTLRFTYEDGPHDCESVAVDAIRRTIYLVTKRPKCAVYELPIPAKPAVGVLTAKRIAMLPTGWFTAMDLSPDGLRAVLLTYGDALEFVRKPSETWAQAFAREPRILAMPRRAQKKSICYGADGKTLYLTSEKLPTPLFRVPVLPDRATSGVASPPASRPARRRKQNDSAGNRGGA